MGYRDTARYPDYADCPVFGIIKVFRVRVKYRVAIITSEHHILRLCWNNKTWLAWHSANPFAYLIHVDLQSVKSIESDPIDLPLLFN